MNVSELLSFKPRRRGLSIAQKAALGGAIALVAGPAIKVLSQTLRQRLVKRSGAPTEAAIDKTLKDTYPASDPPASHYFDIPTNRQ